MIAGVMNTVGHWNRARHNGASRLVLNSSREGETLGERQEKAYPLSAVR